MDGKEDYYGEAPYNIGRKILGENFPNLKKEKLKKVQRPKDFQKDRIIKEISHKIL